MITTENPARYGPMASVTRICKSLNFQRVAPFLRSVSRLSKLLKLNDFRACRARPIPYGYMTGPHLWPPPS